VVASSRVRSPPQSTEPRCAPKVGSSQYSVDFFSYGHGMPCLVLTRKRPLLLHPLIIRPPVLNHLLDGLAVVYLSVQHFARQRGKLRIAREAQRNSWAIVNSPIRGCRSCGSSLS